MTAAVPVLARGVLVALAAITVLVAVAAPAQAHGRGSDATGFDSFVTDAPELAGIEWRVYGGDELLYVSNTSDTELLVLGYEDEPYLRVGPDGVFENQRSPAAFLNQERYETSAPPEADADADPQWEQVAPGPSYGWHDHRIHWMSPQQPPGVAEADERGQVFDWAVPFDYDGESHTVEGELWWVPGPSMWPWLAVGLVVALPALIGLRSQPREVADGDLGSRLEWPGLARPAAAVLGGVTALNLTHLVNDLLAIPLPLSTIALAAGQTLLFTGLGLFGAVRAWRGGDGAFTALGIGAGAVFVGQGLLYASVLSASQLASVFPDWVARLTVAASIAQVLPVGAVALLGNRRLAPAFDVDQVAEEPQPTP